MLGIVLLGICVLVIVRAFYSVALALGQHFGVIAKPQRLLPARRHRIAPPAEGDLPAKQVGQVLQVASPMLAGMTRDLDRDITAKPTAPMIGARIRPGAAREAMARLKAQRQARPA